MLFDIFILRYPQNLGCAVDVYDIIIHFIYDCIIYSCNMSNQSPTQSRRAPGVLRALPETLPFYPYCKTNSKPLHLNKKSKKHKDIEAELNDGEVTIIANKPLHSANPDILGFSLFFFVDSTNRQSLHARKSVVSIVLSYV